MHGRRCLGRWFRDRGSDLVFSAATQPDPGQQPTNLHGEPLASFIRAGPDRRSRLGRRYLIACFSFGHRFLRGVHKKSPVQECLPEQGVGHFSVFAGHYDRASSQLLANLNLLSFMSIRIVIRRTLNRTVCKTTAVKVLTIGNFTSRCVTTSRATIW